MHAVWVLLLLAAAQGKCHPVHPPWANSSEPPKSFQHAWAKPKGVCVGCCASCLCRAMNSWDLQQLKMFTS